jgi:hypothetical protein
MGPARPRSLTFDAGALIALEHGDGRMRSLIRHASASGALIYVPAPVLAQVWRGNPSEAPVAALLKKDTVSVPVLDGSTARAVGRLCGRRGSADIVDASVVLCARLTGSVVVTSDPDDLRHLDPTLVLESL